MATYKAPYDVNCTGALTFGDASFELSQLNTSSSLYDLNNSGTVSITDLLLIISNMSATQSLRDKYLWPFASTSIWNMPLARGNEANFVAAGLSTVNFCGADENIIVNSPNSAAVPVWHNIVGWTDFARQSLHNRERTDNNINVQGSSASLSLPWPNTYILPGGDFNGDTPNWACAIVKADGLGIRQLQPPTHGASTGSPPSSGARNVITEFDLKSSTVDLKADDVVSTVPSAYGAHGGSGMSALGGCIRLGELTPANTNGYIRHALKFEANSELYYSTHDYSGSGGGVGYRWPATQADSCATDNPSCYGGNVTAMVPGALVALKTSFVVKNLITEPARIIARTLMRYGAYVVDSTSSGTASNYAFCVERGPAGRVVGPPDQGATGGEEFAFAWAAQPSTGGGGQAHGFGDGDQQWNSKWPEWQADLAVIIKALFVVNNNAATAIGGPVIAGTAPALRLAPPAPAFSN